jgi:hypothetical protein
MVNDTLSYMGNGFDETELDDELMKLQHGSGNPSDDPSDEGMVPTSRIKR